MKENKILAYCGIDCGACPAYVATQNNDDVLRPHAQSQGIAGRAQKWGVTV